ncbi:MAG: hypothetical protein ACXVBO_10635 [Isosphaeraceae bacterium]
MPIEPWWETNPATIPRQELGMVSPELPRHPGRPAVARELRSQSTCSAAIWTLVRKLIPADGGNVGTSFLRT